MVAMGRYPHLGALAAETDRDRSAVERALAACDVAGLADRDVSTLSGGEFQRARIARALAQEPRALVLDEPTEGLQPSIVEEIQTIIKRIHDSRNCAILLVEQNLDFVREVTQTFAMMESGQISVDGEIGDLTQDLVKQHLSF